ncbi:hypothetical protein, partial [Acidithiobacillus ferrianus]|uniref:hypothetical protein n=1 Tax=Acidithiobacillus ferrianus TaxID=2678518 RepID=UPI0034E5ECE7
RMPFACSIAGYPPLALFSPQGKSAWIRSVLTEMASRRAVTSRGKRNPRGVRKKMRSYPIRDCDDPLHQPCDPIPVILSK